MEQFNRVSRHFERIEKMYSGIHPSSWDERINREDDVISFFIHCYHLRDWIIHLNRVGVTSKDVDAFINQHEELKICTDFANGSKHCTLTHKTRTKQRQPHIITYSHKSLIGANDEGYISQFTILSGQKDYDVLVLAKKCVELWTVFRKEIEQKQIKT